MLYRIPVLRVVFAVIPPLHAALDPSLPPSLIRDAFLLVHTELETARRADFIRPSVRTFDLFGEIGIYANRANVFTSIIHNIGHLP